MNKNLLFVFIAICITAVSCKDKGDDPTPQKEKSPLLGLWNATQVFYDTNRNGTFEAFEEEYPRPGELNTFEFLESGDALFTNTYRNIDSILISDTTRMKWLTQDSKKLLLIGRMGDTNRTFRDTTFVDIITISNTKMTWESGYNYLIINDSTISIKGLIILEKI